jgi:hypothetical protein
MDFGANGKESRSLFCLARSYYTFIRGTPTRKSTNSALACLGSFFQLHQSIAVNESVEQSVSEGITSN